MPTLMMTDYDDDRRGRLRDEDEIDRIIDDQIRHRGEDPDDPMPEDIDVDNIDDDEEDQE